jgi:DNA-binding beta-propeller fold protein YncE/mono/diheme cytochrome c family protein
MRCSTLVLRAVARGLLSLGIALGALTAPVTQAQTALLQEAFGSGVGAFTATGSVTTITRAARMRASLFSSDGAITSRSVNTQGYSNITVAFDRVTAGLDLGEGGVAEVSINGAAFTSLESTRATTNDRVTLSLGAAAANQSSVIIRFRVNANSTTESYDVDNVVVSGTQGSSNAGRPAIGDFVTFESGQVRPLALSSSGQRLYAVNTPDNRVEVFDVSGTTPVLIESVGVGLEPVAVALLNDTQLWVVNHLSDSVSIVDVSSSPARITNTLLVADEPRDIVFAGTGNRWAFITAAHRGQNAPFAPQLTTEGIGRADVWVFDTSNLGVALGGTPTTILNMFGDTLRALAKNASGSRVYAAVFNSGNRTTVLTDDIGAGSIAKASPTTAADGTGQPETGLIVQFNGTNWLDDGDPTRNIAPRNWSSRVKLNLPDYDVFTIDTTTSVPSVISRVAGVGTTLFNMAVNPANGNVYVTNHEARNVVRFEGPGSRSTTVRGHFVESRISVISGSTVQPRHLNKHITSYGQNVGTAAEKAAALAQPLEMAVSPDGANLFVVAMGSNKLARLSTSQLEANTFTPSASSHANLTGGGPTGVVLDAARNRAFVLTRFDNGISVVNTSTLAEAAHVRMFNPEPAVVTSGRPFLYDANLTSSRGDSSCGGCHTFGDMDHLAWDLGNPDEVRVQNPTPYNVNIPLFGRNRNLHPMKGPMTTQSLRGMKGNGPMHWRGDRTGVSRTTGETLEEQAFEDFNVAFVGLLGRDTQLTDTQMDAFAKFALRLTYPPNPIANLDNSLTATQQTGQTVYNTVTSDTITTCNGCHVINPVAGRFGTDGTMSIEGNGVEEDMKIPHLRNMYQKVGMFAENTQEAGAPNLGDQIRGFGYDNSGASGTISLFLSAPVFTLSATQRGQVEQLVLAAPSDMNPIVGQQVTVTPANAARTDVRNRLNLLVQRALVTSPRAECELVAKGVLQNTAKGWVMNGSQSFVPNVSTETALTLQALLDQASAAGAALTFTCAPPGNGARIGVDRDADGLLDRNDP